MRDLLAMLVVVASAQKTRAPKPDVAVETCSLLDGTILLVTAAVATLMATLLRSVSSQGRVAFQWRLRPHVRVQRVFVDKRIAIRNLQLILFR